MNNKANDEIFRRKCANCRMMFRTKSKIAWYCSENCEEAATQQRNQKRSQKRHCANCGGVFIFPKSPGARYCSDNCEEAGENKSKPKELIELFESDTDGEEVVLVPKRINPLNKIVKVTERVYRAFRLDTTLYDELRTDPSAPSETFKYIIFLGLLIAFVGMLRFGPQGIGEGLVTFCVDFYFFLIITWLVGVIIARKDVTFNQIQTPFAYAFTPLLLRYLPSPWFLLSIWGFVTLFIAIRKVLGTRIIIALIILIGYVIFDAYLLETVVQILLELLFNWVFGKMIFN